MSVQRQKSQLFLAFMAEGRGEAPAAVGEGTEAPAAERAAESPDGTERLFEEVCDRANLWKALKQVQANRGGPGVDGRTVEALPGYLKEHGPALRPQVLAGTYEPQPVRRVQSPKPDGGVRKLGLPTVLDRFVQQAVLQVLQRRWDRTFSEHRYGFRPNRSAHQAVAAAQQYVAEGRRWVVDLDVEKFFDRVNHDHLMTRVSERVNDKRLLRLIRAFLSIGRVVKDLASYLRGWRGYFGFGQWPHVLRDLDGWGRHRLRSYLWKNWRGGRVRFRELTRLGVDRGRAVTVAGSSRGPWPQSATRAMHEATPAAYWDALGLPRLAAPPTA